MQERWVGNLSYKVLYIHNLLGDHDLGNIGSGSGALYYHSRRHKSYTCADIVNHLQSMDHLDCQAENRRLHLHLRRSL